MQSEIAADKKPARLSTPMRRALANLSANGPASWSPWSRTSNASLEALVSRDLATRALEANGNVRYAAVQLVPDAPEAGARATVRGLGEEFSLAFDGLEWRDDRGERWGRDGAGRFSSAGRDVLGAGVVAYRPARGSK